MSDTSHRHPGGQPSGGRFAPDPRSADTGVSLDGPDEPGSTHDDPTTVVHHFSYGPEGMGDVVGDALRDDHDVER